MRSKAKWSGERGIGRLRSDVGEFGPNVVEVLLENPCQEIAAGVIGRGDSAGPLCGR